MDSCFSEIVGCAVVRPKRSIFWRSWASAALRQAQDRLPACSEKPPTFANRIVGGTTPWMEEVEPRLEQRPRATHGAVAEPASPSGASEARPGRRRSQRSRTGTRICLRLRASLALCSARRPLDPPTILRSRDARCPAPGRWLRACWRTGSVTAPGHSAPIAHRPRAEHLLH